MIHATTGCSEPERSARKPILPGMKTKNGDKAFPEYTAVTVRRMFRERIFCVPPG